MCKIIMTLIYKIPLFQRGRNISLFSKEAGIPLREAFAMGSGEIF